MARVSLARHPGAAAARDGRGTERRTRQEPTAARGRARMRAGRRAPRTAQEQPHTFSTGPGFARAMSLDEKSIEELLHSVRVFAQRHEEALASGVPARMLEAVEGLHTGLATTLAGESAHIHNGLLALGRTPPRTPGHFAAAHQRLASGDVFEREAWAYTALAKRVAECEGALMYLKLTLSKGTADGPVLGAWARRVAAETTTVARTLAALRVVLDAWSDAARAALAAHAGRPRTEPTLRPRSARDALRAARECLLSGVPEGAAAPLSSALRVGLAAPVFGDETPRALDDVLDAWDRAGAQLPAPEADLRAAAHVLAQGPHDPVLMWRLLDFVELTVQKAGMTKLPA